MTGKRATVAFAALTSLVLLTHLSNIWRLETYPFTDLPNHLSEAYLLRALGNPDSPLHAFYKNDISPVAPGTLHTFFCAQFSDIELGNRIFYSLYMVTLLAGMMLLIRRAGGDLWMSLLSLLFIYNFNTMWGFTGFTAGLGLLLPCFGVVLLFNEKPTLLNACAAGAMMLVLYYCHILVFFFALAAAVVIMTFQQNFRHGHIAGLIALAPGVFLCLYWVNHSDSFSFSTHGFLVDYYHEEYLGSLWKRPLYLLLHDNPLAIGRAGQLFSLVFSLPLLGTVLWSLASPRTAAPAAPAATMARRAAWLFVLVAAACFALMPNRLPGQQYLFERFSVTVLLGTVWVVSFAIPPRYLIPARACIAVMVIVHAIGWFWYFSDFREEARPVQAILRGGPEVQGHSLSAIITDGYFRSTPSFIHYQNYQLVWNGGAVPTSSVEYRFHLFSKRDPESLPNYYEWIPDVARAGWLADQYRKMDLMLCHGPDAVGDSIRSRGYRLLRREGAWMLFARN